MNHRRPWSGHPGLLRPVLDLLGRCFDGFTATESLARGHGLRWEECSTPFVVLDARGRPIAHVGVLELCLVLDGREEVVGGVHAVCTDPAHRRRGRFRALMEEAAAWCDGRYRTLVLTAGEPALYEPFGFRVFPEHLFAGGWRGAAGPNRFRELNRDEPADRALLHRLLAERTGVSLRLGVVRDRDVFLFDTARIPIRYSADLDLALVARRDGGTIRILDVVAREMPPLGEILEAAGEPAGRVEVCFPPDRLAFDLEPEPHVLDGDDHLMVRGPFLSEGAKAMLSPAARC